MASNVNRRASTSWNVLVQWVQGQPDKPAYKCVKDVEALREWKEGTDIASRAWQLFSWTMSQSQEPLNTTEQKFAQLKRMLLAYLETAPAGNSFSVEQLQGIQTEIEENETLVEMWNCTKKHYFHQARNNRVNSEFPDFVFGFSYFGPLAERVKKIKAQIDDLNHPRSQAFVTTSHWMLRNTRLTHAFVPETISSQFTNITVLDMSHNQFATVGDLSQLNNLKQLLLTNNRLRKIIAAHLPLSLEFLSLAGNEFATQPNLAQLVHLKLLDLSDNRLTAITSRSLPAGLKNLYIRHNSLHSIDSVQTALPDLEIDSDVKPFAKKRRQSPKE